MIYEQSISFDFTFATIYGFFQKLGQCMSHKAENWHALLHEQYLSTHRFLDFFFFEYYANVSTQREVN